MKSMKDISTSRKLKNAWKKNILIVENDPLVQDALVMALRQQHNLQLCDSGEAALKQLIVHEPFDLVLLDIIMPGMSGLEVVKKMKRIPQYRSVPILFTTVAEYRQKAEQFSPFFLSKPYGLKKLEYHVNWALGVNDT